METNKISDLWKKYHEICIFYRNRPIPALIKYECVFHDKSFEEQKALLEKRREINKKNEEIEQIIYVIQNEHKIEETVSYLLEAFAFSREEIEKNISFYDAVFNLSKDVTINNIKFFIKLLGSKENFLSAMRVGTPLESLETIKMYSPKSFLGIMSYKKKQLFVDKLISLSTILSITHDDAAKIFVSDWRYIYHSSQTTKEIINQWCSILKITPIQLGKILKKQPCFLSHNESHLKNFIQSLKNSFSLSTEEAISVIISCPNVVNAPFDSMDDILSNANGSFPLIVSKKPWLYKIHEIIRYYRGYDYGDYETILKFFKHIEDSIGEIVDVQFKSLKPRVQDGVRNINKVTYTTLIVKKQCLENEYCFVSFGSGYNTCNRYKGSKEEQLLKAIFGQKTRYFAEFIVNAPKPRSEDYERMLTYMFIMSSTGNTLPLECALKNGRSIVVEKLQKNQFKNFEYDDISCIFHTLDVISTDKIQDYLAKYTFY